LRPRLGKGTTGRELIANQVADLSKKRRSESDEKIGPELWREMHIELRTASSCL
jgi:hypothetical protein